MRPLLTLLLVIAAVSPARSQDNAVPDTLAWRGYYPLEVGNAWEWETWIFVAYNRMDRRVIVADTSVDGQSYFVQVATSISLDDVTGLPHFRTDTLFLRYESLDARLVARRPGEATEWDYTCNLGADFGARVSCGTGEKWYVDGWYAAEGEYLRVVDDTVHFAAEKHIYNLGGGRGYYHGVGMLPGIGDGATGRVDFTYLRIGGREYGERALFPPVLMFPEENGLNNTDAVFYWRGAAGADAYQFQISRDSTQFDDLAIDTTVVDSAFADIVGEPDGWYHWRVRALSAADTSWWSPPRRFYLKFPVGVEGRSEVPEGLSIQAHYPNPVYSTATLVFELGRPGRVRLELVDLLGRRIRLQEVGYLESGVHTFTLRDITAPSGSYFARLKAGSRNDVVGLTVVR